MIRALRKLAARLDAEWKTAGYRIGAFPQLAARCLAGFEPGSGDRLSALSDWLRQSKTFPPPLNPFGSSGPPAFTVWANSRFVVNVYAYLTPQVVIHDHNFAGAFVNVLGRSLHCTYRFADAERIDTSLLVGALGLVAGEMIPEGRAETIEPGSRFIHQVWHLSQPTMVVVVRTPPLPRRTLRQFEYLRPAIATEIFRSEALVPQGPQRFQYTRKMMQCLRTSSEGIPYLTHLVEKERPWDAVWHLVENWQLLKSRGALTELIARGAKSHGAWFREMGIVASRANVFYSINWNRVVDESDRIVLACLLTLESWPEIARVLKSLLPEVAPEVLVTNSLRRLARSGSIPMTFTDERHAMLFCTLRASGRRDEWKKSVRESFDMQHRTEWKAARQLERELGDEDLLKPLFNFEPSAPAIHVP